MTGIADLQIASSAAQKDPRMAAASELVSSEGLEALGLPPATEAALNIQEATNLIDSADQLLAQAGKPTSATVLQQRQQQALDGIAGALARVQQSTPPRPMRGQPRPPMMAQQRPPMMGQPRPPMMGQPRPPMMGQQRPPMAGQQSPVRPPMQGVAGMPAPNMVRAAQGGIVGFDDGGNVEGNNFSRQEFMYGPLLKKLGVGPMYDFGGELNEDFMNRAKKRAVVESAVEKYGPDAAMPVGNNQPIPMLMQKYGSEMVMKYLEGQKELKEESKFVAPENRDAFEQKEANFMSDFPLEFKLDVYETQSGPLGLRYQQVKEEQEARARARAAQGMAGGGIVAFAGPDGSVVDEEIISTGRYGDVVPYSSTASQFYAERAAAEQAQEARRDALRNLTVDQAQAYSSLIGQGANLDEALSYVLGESAPSDELILGDQLVTRSDSDGDAVETVVREYLKEGSDIPGGDGNPTTNGETSDVVEDIVTRINEIDVEAATSPLTKIVSEHAEKTLGRDRTAEEKQRRQDALDFYGLSDRERDLRQQAADTQTQALAAELDPEVLRQQKINSILGNLSGPGGIIGAGNRGAASRTAFDKRIRDIEAEKALLPIASELETLGMDRAAREKAFGAGTELAKNFSAEMNTALQSLANLSSVQTSSATSAAIQNARTSITALTTQASNELAKLREKGLNIRDNRDYRRKQDDSIATIGVNIATAIAEVNGDTLMDEATKQSTINSLNKAFTAARNQILGVGSGSEDPELEAILEQYN
jgi:hypothetical protein